MWIMSIITALLFSLGLVTTAIAVGPVATDECEFHWTAPTQKTDGTPVGPLREYQLFVANASGAYSLGTPAGVIPAPATTTRCSAVGVTATEQEVNGRQYYAVVRVVGANGAVSTLSAEVAFIFKKSLVAPKPPEVFEVLEVDVTTSPITIRMRPRGW